MISLKSLLLEMDSLPPTMYHGTTETLSNRAYKNGLIPGGSVSNQKRNFTTIEYEKGIYLTTNANVAAHFGQAPNPRENVVILTVSTKGLDPKKAKVDPNAPNSIIYFDKIPSKNIVDWKILNNDAQSY